MHHEEPASGYSDSGGPFEQTLRVFRVVYNTTKEQCLRTKAKDISTAMALDKQGEAIVKKLLAHLPLDDQDKWHIVTTRHCVFYNSLFYRVIQTHGTPAICRATCSSRSIASLTEDSMEYFSSLSAVPVKIKRCGRCIAGKFGVLDPPEMACTRVLYDVCKHVLDHNDRETPTLAQMAEGVGRQDGTNIQKRASSTWLTSPKRFQEWIELNENTARFIMNFYANPHNLGVPDITPVDQMFTAGPTDNDIAYDPFPLNNLYSFPEQ